MEKVLTSNFSSIITYKKSGLDAIATAKPEDRVILDSMRAHNILFTFPLNCQAVPLVHDSYLHQMLQLHVCMG